MQHKYRCWDRTNKQWVTEFYIGSDGTLYGFYGNYHPRELEKMEEGVFDLIQWTGLNDKDGKEIYECDIVKIRMLKPAEVSFEAAAFCFGGAYSSSLRDFIPHGWVRGDWCERLEVIGNIYENRELLK